MRFYSYLNSAGQILTGYNGGEPFSSFLKKYFSANKKYGSKDRKYIAHLCYCYFRLGKALKEIPVDERILTGLFLSSSDPNDMLENLRPGWNEKAGIPLKDKLALLNRPFAIEEVFPWKDQLSNSVDAEQFNASFFLQPDLFIRLRPGKEKKAMAKLTGAEIYFRQLSETCIALTNTTKVESILELDHEAVIQDYSSQRAGEYLKIFKPQTVNSRLLVWDCCAASGGKSIMAKDILGNIDLAVSDIRESILANLKKRFEKAGIKNYKSFVVNLTQSTFTTGHSSFDLIIADVPCSGSGTWGLTPEQLYYFQEGKIEEYALLQKKIISNVIPHLKKGGYLLYITCSVFKKENEDTIDYITRESGLRLIKQEILNGYDKKADTLFAALLKKEL